MIIFNNVFYLGEDLVLEFIRKRDGRLVAFEEEKIVSAVQKSVQAVGGTDMEQAAGIGRQVVGILEVIYKDGRPRHALCLLLWMGPERSAAEGFHRGLRQDPERSAKAFPYCLGADCQLLHTLQGEAAGAQAFANFDTLLAPFIRYDGLSYNEVRQSMQEFIFNVNVPTRVGFQTPFTNITLDLSPPRDLSEEAVIMAAI